MQDGRLIPACLSLVGPSYSLLHIGYCGAGQFAQDLSGRRIDHSDLLHGRWNIRCVKHQYSTLTRYKPLAGAVAPAAERSFAFRILVRSAALIVLFPTSRNVPTRFRTM